MAGMNLNEFHVRAAHVNELDKMGQRIIQTLTRYAKENVSKEMQIESGASPSLLRLTFYGLPILFRVELRLTESGGEGKLVAYYLSYDNEPKEMPLKMQYPFDRLGNVGWKNEAGDKTAKLTEDSCADHIFASLFTKIAQDGSISLRP